MFEYLDNLNDEQKKAAMHLDGPLLIIAGAGSGKTTTLINRVAYMVDNNIPPENILLLTFTNAAADNMKTRASKLSNEACSRVTACTYHSFCAEILRAYHKEVDLPRDFVIITPVEEERAFKLCKSLLGYSSCKTFPKNKDVLDTVSACLNACIPVETGLEDLLFDDEEVLSKVTHTVKEWYKYKKENHLVGYDDLLVYMHALLQKDEVRDALESHYQYVMVDEYQDTNVVQEKIVFLLTKENKNIVVVGDDYQCWHKDCQVVTSNGVKKISELQIGDEVQTILKGKVNFSQVTNKSSHLANVLKITTESGKTIRVTKNHVMFASQPDFSTGYYVYLMYRKDRGFRIGITSGGKTKEVRNRTASERADRLWYIKRCETKNEASFYENLLSLQYQIPQLPFYCTGRNMMTTQEDVNKIFDKFGQNGLQLLNDFGMSFGYPNYVPQGTVRNNESKKNVYLQMDAGHRFNQVSYESEGVRIRKCFSCYKDAYCFAQELTKQYDANFVEKLFIKKKTYLQSVMASNLTKTMFIPVEENNVIKLEKIVDICEENDENSEVYHIEVAQTGILIANHIVSHNSIYKFRGADIQNIINFPKRIMLIENENGEDFVHFPRCNENLICKQVVIDTNYRSTKEILAVANKVMDEHAAFGYPKQMKNIGKSGMTPTLRRPYNTEEEAGAVFDSIKKWEASGKNLAEYAVLERNSNSSAKLEIKLTQAGIPFEKMGGLKFLEHQCIQDMLSFFKVFTNRKDELSWFHLLDIVSGIGEVYAHKVMEDLKIGSIENHPVWSKKSFYKELIRLTTFVYEMEKNAGTMDFSRMFALTEQFYFELVEHKIQNMIVKDEDKRLEAYSQMENDKETVGLLKEIASKYNSVVAFLDSIVLDATPTVPNEGSVVISTIHSAKGMEWEHVDLIDIMDGIVPNINNCSEDDDMEDLRCLYVALTRAKDEMVVYTPAECMVNGRVFYKPSRFLETCMENGLLKPEGFVKKEKQKVYLNVPYYSKEEAKQLGAKWDNGLRCWFSFDDNPKLPTLLRRYGQAYIR